VILGSKSQKEQVETITRATGQILERGAVPIILRGDHGTPSPVLRGFEEHGPLCVVQIGLESTAA
jgi:agmatinase